MLVLVDFLALTGIVIPLPLPPPKKNLNLGILWNLCSLPDFKFRLRNPEK